MYKVIATGSTGNAVLYNRNVLIDCGVPFAKIKPYLNDIKIVMYSHCHSDHLNINTLKKIQLEKPGIRVACGEFLVEHLPGIRNIDIIEPNKWYNYGSFLIASFWLKHDVLNVGWRVFFKQPDGSYYKIIHATDAADLEGITAKGYNLYSIEHNYNSETIIEKINEDRKAGRYSYAIGAMNSHLSEQQAQDFIFKNKGEKYEVLRLHESSNNL